MKSDENNVQHDQWCVETFGEPYILDVYGQPRRGNGNWVSVDSLVFFKHESDMIVHRLCWGGECEYWNVGHDTASDN